MYSFGRKICFLLILLALAVVYEDRAGDIPYFLLLIASLVAAITLIAHVARGGVVRIVVVPVSERGGRSPRYLVELLIVSNIFVLMSWFYGAMLGLVNGVDESKIFRNFFGLLLYGFFPIVVLMKFTLKDVANCYTILAVLNLGFAAWAILAGIDALSFSIDVVTISDFRFLYSAGFVVVFPFVAYMLALYGSPKSNAHQNVIIASMSRFPVGSALVVSSIIIISSMSKGLILGFLVIYLVILMAIIFRASFRIRLKLGLILLTLCLSVGVVYLTNGVDAWFSLLVGSFTTQDPGNEIRASQAHYLMEEFTFLGSGLGSGLRSGYVRDDVGYGFELTYLNLIHKLGVFSLSLFASYLLTVILIMYKLFRDDDMRSASLALGLMGYLIPGMGNPLLLSPTAVVCHLFAMAIIIKDVFRVDVNVVQPKIRYGT